MGLQPTTTVCSHGRGNARGDKKTLGGGGRAVSARAQPRWLGVNPSKEGHT